jgi:NAD(P)H dehydrogenase (quinone)
MANVLIVFDTRYGNTMRLAEAVAAGAREVSGTTVKLARAREVAPEAIIQKNERWAAAHREFMAYPEATNEDLEWCHGLVLGSPTRFGNMSAPLKTFIDGTSRIWLKGGLIGKVGAAFTSSSSLHGGQETTIVSMWFPLIHQGMVIVGLPYSLPELVTTARGGSPYGPASVSGPAADQGPDEVELKLARALGQRVAEISAKLS